ncbi:MAG: hypothetical protein ACRC8S_01380 [Fimbriiglobus sp.]
MPLRDHFRPPTSKFASWEGLHATWPVVMLQHLRGVIPKGYVAEPRVHLGTYVETELPSFDEFEVLIFDAEKERELVAAIEIVSPRNLDRLAARNEFVGKCAALLQKGIAVSIVDLVTTRHFNLYAELLTFIGQTDPSFGSEPPSTYTVSCRWLQAHRSARLETLANTLSIGQPLPTLPIWVTPTHSVPLDLEVCYEKACEDLSIP